MKKFISLFLFALLTFSACGGEKNKTEDDNDDEEVVGNPAKVNFLEDFYGKYFDAINDQESLNNLLTDVVSERGFNVIGNIMGGDSLNYSKVFRPQGLDSLESRNDITVDVQPMENTDDLLYNVSLIEKSGEAHDIVIAVAGDNDEFKIDSVANPQFNAPAEEVKE